MADRTILKPHSGVGGSGMAKRYRPKGSRPGGSPNQSVSPPSDVLRLQLPSIPAPPSGVVEASGSYSPQGPGLEPGLPSCSWTTAPSSLHHPGPGVMGVVVPEHSWALERGFCAALLSAFSYHICSLIFLPSSSMVLILKSMPAKNRCKTIVINFNHRALSELL